MYTFNLSRRVLARSFAVYTVCALIFGLFPIQALTSHTANAAPSPTISATVVPNPISGNPEYFELSYSGTDPLDLTGWKVTDSAPFSYIFGSVTLTNGDTYRVCQDSGNQTGCDADWGAGNVWNNDNDTFSLFDAGDSEVLSFSWSDPEEDEVVSGRTELPERGPAERISAIFECVEPLDGGMYRAHFGYENHNVMNVDIPVGDDNKFSGGGSSDQDRGQTTLFEYPAPNHPGGRDGRTGWYPDNAFHVDFDGTNLVWTLKGPDGNTRTATANSDSKPCPVPQELTIVAHKIVCEDEADIPNQADWSGLELIDADTAEDWLLSHESCSLVPDWSFEWVLDSETSDPGDTHTGPAGDDWSTFGPTDSNGMTSVTLTENDLDGETKVWLREVLKDDYIPFTHGPNGDKNVDDYTAAFFCNTDVLNYDNYEWINDLTFDETYYCVAWNYTELEEIEMCKKDVTGAPIEDWGMLLTNSEDEYERTTGGDGCVTVEVDPNEGPWRVIEEEREDWILNDIDVEGGSIFEDEGVGCEFFGKKTLDRQDGPMCELGQDCPCSDCQSEPDEYSCTFVNEEENDDPWCAYEGIVIDHTADEDAFQNDGDPVDPARRNVSAVETIAPYANFDGKEGTDWQVDPLDFYSLGTGGFITYQFTGDVAFDQAGPDIGVYEITGGGATQQTDEQIEVSVSEDGLSWQSLGTFIGDAAIDIAPAGLDFVKYVRLTDQSQGIQGNNGDGYDVDGIVILNGSCGEEPVDEPLCDYGFGSENMLSNGSFEEEVVVADGLWERFETVTGWLVESIVDGLSAGLELHRGWSGNEAADGEQYAELDAHEDTDRDSVKISQDVVTEEGARYELRWAFAPRHDIDAAQNQLSVLVDDTEVATEGPEAGLAPLAQGDWTFSTYEFEAGSALTQVAFEDAGEPQNDQLGTFLDNAVLCKVADPVPGCTDETATNYDPEATINDGSCSYVPRDCEIGENLLVNGSFEDPAIDGDWALSSIADWTITDVLGAAGPQAELWNGLYGGASDENQNVELDSTEPTMIAQEVATTLGASYELRFDFSPRPSTGLGDNDVDALVDGTVLVNAAGDGSQLTNNDWSTYSATFTADTLLTEIAFRDNGQANRVGSLIDNTVLCLVTDPEPERYLVDGYKWEDEDGDGIWDEDEEGIEGWTIKITNGKDTLSTTTDGDGHYTFMVPEGSWTVSEVQQSGWTQTYPEENSCPVEVGPKQISAVAYQISDEIVPTESESCNFGNKEEEESITRSGGSGGGSGSSRPRCALLEGSYVSGLSLMTLNWETSRGNELEIAADGIEIFSTDDNDDVEEGTLTVSPAGVEEFTLTVHRGSRSDTCELGSNDFGRGGDFPIGQVLGEQVSVVPLGAADAGAGGTAPAAPFGSMIALFGALLSLGMIRITKNG